METTTSGFTVANASFCTRKREGFYLLGLIWLGVWPWYTFFVFVMHKKCTCSFYPGINSLVAVLSAGGVPGDGPDRLHVPHGLLRQEKEQEDDEQVCLTKGKELNFLGISN